MILKGKIGRIGVFTILFVCALWIVTPKAYIHQLLNHNHQTIKTNGETSVQTEANPDCDFDKYDSPVYFTIFKFINNFIPLKPKHEAVLITPAPHYSSFVGDSGASRAPPIA
ncbi:MAG TPA: hypothetical protein VN026_00515 [Bacteroidia bacterium]|jgi:hypothetical protein|nr:hypothetical protein [Bacteroidia bacterium]